MTYRSGFGYDIHRLTPGRRLMLGGVHIPSPLGLEGHSDADVLLHAICDALLGAAALGDIGMHFPNADPLFKNISSLKLLSMVNDMIINSRFQIVNVDSTVVLERPRIAEYVPEMQHNISKTLNLPASVVSVKATTNEALGSIGKGEGCAAFAVTSLCSLDSET